MGGAIGRMLKWLGAALLFLITALCLAIAIVPRFLDRIYYRGPVSSHFDGQRFFNPDGEDTVRPPSGRSRGAFLLRFVTQSDDRPPWPEHVAVTPSRPPAQVEGERMLVTWVGHATMLVQTAGLNILTDPIWSETAGPFGFGPRRVTVPGVRFEDLPKIDLVLVSHNHYDHLDLATLKRLWERDRPLIVTPLGNDAILRSRGIASVSLDWNDSVTLTDKGYEVNGWLPRCDPNGACPGDRAIISVERNHHWGSRWFSDRNRALWSAFTVRFMNGGGDVFFAGDTGYGDGGWVKEAGQYSRIRLALIPIGAFRFEPNQMSVGSHIGPIDAVKVFAGLNASRAIGIHWGTFRLSYEAWDTPPRMLRETMRCAGYPAGLFGTVAIGRPIEIPPYATPPRPQPLGPDCLNTPAVRSLR